MIPTLYPGIEALFSDLDGTLIDSEVPIRNSWSDILARYGCDFSRFDYGEIIGLPEDEKIGAVFDFFGLSVDKQEFDRQLQERLHERLPDEMVLMPGALQLLDTCHATGAPMGMITSASQWHAELAIAKFGFGKYFRTNCIVTADTEGLEARKPSPAPYLMGAKRLGAKPFRCIAFEDTVCGATAALRAGMNVVAIPHDLSPREGFKSCAPAYVIPEGKCVGEFRFEDIVHLLPK